MSFTTSPIFSAPVESMKRGTAEADAGSALAAGAGGALGEILSAVERTVGDVGAINRAANEIARNSRTALAATGLEAENAGAASSAVTLSRANAASAEDAAASVEEITASMQEMNASAEELAQIARDLQQEVARFRVGGDEAQEVEAIPLRPMIGGRVIGAASVAA